jgi:glycosyltransferase involved in cell wall biosynthesis
MNSNISFVIPAYDCAGTISETVESIFQDNFQKGDEIIIVNDGSTDNTLQILKRLQVLHPMIQIISNKQNLGCPASRNVGIRKARNKLIFNLDSDNILTQNSITELKDYLLKNDADAAAFGVIMFFTKDVSNVTHKWEFKHKRLYLSDLLAGHINPGPAGNFLYTKEIWNNVGHYWEYGKGLHEAWGFHLKLLARGAKYVVLPDFYYYHRYGYDSLYVRESKNVDDETKLTNKMIKPFLGLVDKEDVEYMKNNNWFRNLNESPIRVKNHKMGFKGEIVVVNKPFRERVIAVINNVFR